MGIQLTVVWGKGYWLFKTVHWFLKSFYLQIRQRMSNTLRNRARSTVIHMQETEDTQHKCMRKFCSCISLMMNSCCCKMLQCLGKVMICVWLCFYGLCTGWKVDYIQIFRHRSFSWRYLYIASGMRHSSCCCSVRSSGRGDDLAF